MELNPQQKKAAEYTGPKDHLLVLAGAGTGKTRTIIGRTIFLLKNNVPGKRIVLLTFTRKAAAEIVTPSIQPKPACHPWSRIKTKSDRLSEHL